jgi:hypothetical protein
MQETTKDKISQLPATQDVALELGTNNWCSIRITHKLRISFFKWMLKTKNYQIFKLPYAQVFELESNLAI